MTKDTTECYCHSCGKEIANSDLTCPHCGDDLRKVGRDVLEINVFDSVKVSEPRRRFRQKTHGRRGYTQQATYEETTSGKTKRPARKQLYINRTNDMKTVKRHYVEEWDGSKWVLVHDEWEEYPAKRR